MCRLFLQLRPVPKFQVAPTSAKLVIARKNVFLEFEVYLLTQFLPYFSAWLPTLFKLILKQFEDLLVLILLGAAVVSFVLGLLESPEDRLSAMVEPTVILIILIANAAVGVIQETNAEKAIEKLKEMEASEARVRRQGRVTTISPRYYTHTHFVWHLLMKTLCSELVPGDIVMIANGDKVPADLRIVKSVTGT